MSDHAATTSGHNAPTTAATTPTTTPAADAMVSLIQTTIATVLGPLVAEIAASRQTNERQSDRIAELERENGRLSERLVLAVPPASPVAGQQTPEAPAAATDVPAQHQINPGALLPWLFTALALMSGGRAAIGDVSQETLVVGVIIVAVAVVAYVAWKRLRS